MLYWTMISHLKLTDSASQKMQLSACSKQLPYRHGKNSVSLSFSAPVKHRGSAAQNVSLVRDVQKGAFFEQKSEWEQKDL